MVTVIAFILILGVLILVHEVGHFVVARRLGIGVEEFGIGFPPRLFSWVRRGVRYSFNLVPFGGFVRLRGEDDVAAPAADPSAGISFTEASRTRRAAVMAAGVTMNFLLGAVLLAVGFAVGLPQIVDDPNAPGVRDLRVVVASVVEGSPAAAAGVRAGDRLLGFGGEQLRTATDFQTYTASRAGQPLDLSLERDGRNVAVTVTPEAADEFGGRSVVGVNLLEVGTVASPWWQAPWHGLQAAAQLCVGVVVGLGEIFGKLFSGRAGEVDVAGPVGVAVLTGQAVSLGWRYVLQFAAVLSLNLAIINLLPLPALDGGRLAFLAVEGIRRRALPQRAEAMINRVGFTAIVALLLLITVADVRRFGGGLWRAVVSWVSG